MPAVNAMKITAPLEASTAALVEPLGCIIHSSDMVAKRGATRGECESAERRVRSVLICGAGPAGLLFTQYLRNVLGYEGFLFVSDPNAAQATTGEDVSALTKRSIRQAPIWWKWCTSTRAAKVLSI